MADLIQPLNPSTRKPLTAERLREILHYDPETGLWTWLVATGRRIKVGERASAISGAGYIQIGIDRHPYQAHRLAFLYMTGEWPTVEVDHENMNRSDNRWINIRQATRSQNRANGKRHSNNTTGFKGVTFDKSTRKYRAQTKKNSKHIALGSYTTPEEAADAYALAAAQVHGEFARTA